MKTFTKIGLPWACSLCAIFYLGLTLGHQTDQQQVSKVPKNPQKNESYEENQIVPKFEKNGKLDKSTADKKTEQKADNELTDPELPPNLIRIMEGGDIIERMGAYLDALRAMDEGNVIEVVNAFEALPKGYGRHLEMKLLMRSWAAIDPEAALAYANKTLDPKSEKRFGISEVLAGWANLDPKSAIAWARSNHSGKNPGDNPLLVGVIRGIAEKSLGAADQIFRELPEGNARWQAATFLAQKYSDAGIEQAIEWANQFPEEDEKFRQSILGQIGGRLAYQDISATAQWVQSMKEDKAALTVMDNLLIHWANKDAGSAAKWVSELSDDNKRIHGMQQLTSRWSLTDPVATAEWLNTFPPSPKLDPVVKEFVNRISTRDPEGAAGWAMSIVDPGTKEKAVKKALAAWERVDPEKAKLWQQTNAPEIK